MIHNELIGGGDHEIFTVIALQCLDMIFTNVPNQKEKYLQIYGNEALEKCQYSKHESVYESTINLLEKHFNCNEVEEDDLVDLGQKDQFNKDDNQFSI